VRKGVVGSIQEAFDIWLAKGKPAYMDKTKLGESDAIKMIHDAGGLAIMAHSHLMHYDTFAEARDKLLELKELGLDGFEVFYSGMPKEYTDGLLALAESHGFAISGGSDYHGDNKPGIFMGTGKDNDLNIPDTILEHLKTVQLKKEAQLG
ncbi:MAG: phosphoesterase, partial [Calditrichaeota bacterium]|nr:phosphoesterase [Calditrichota bacterium]